MFRHTTEKPCYPKALIATGVAALLVCGVALACVQPAVRAVAAPAGINIVTAPSSSANGQTAAADGSAGGESASPSGGINITTSSGSKINITGGSSWSATPDATQGQADTDEGKPQDGAIRGNDVDVTAVEPVGPSQDLLAWAEVQDCAACHVDAMGVQAEVADSAADVGADDKAEADAEPEVIVDLARLHTPFGCVVCHADDALVEVHEQMDAANGMPTKLSKTTVGPENCLVCHDVAGLVEATSEYTGLRDGNGTTVNPHGAMFMVDEHKLFTCASCHEVHGATKPLAKAAADLCKGCHHANVYECYTCH